MDRAIQKVYWKAQNDTMQHEIKWLTELRGYLKTKWLAELRGYENQR